MDYKIVSGSLVTALIHKDESIDPQSVREDVLRALSLCGYTPWRGMSLELFAGRDGGLLLARAEKEGEISLSGFAMSVLAEYFTE